ncbi:xylose isomerase [Cohnella xylanilytica]|uniref:TIM barrel protein n=1 Tax=Cohnella xylanilytica TaxID=557555 RepID=A0A841TXB3_9BACL|nr:TIM barrel protein [Cohnella xylanilytica]MBB6690284.1 TIM barrel protein [Cohnella xylanilytica]GIO11563.1 xylose isomerase [Cohnella xylanilytica]
MKLELGISANFAIKRWADPNDWVRLIARDLGIGRIQFSFDQFDPRSRPELRRAYAERVREACERYGAKIHSTFTGLSIYPHNLLYHPLPEGREDGIDWFRNAFAMTRELGADAIGGPYGGMDAATFRSPELREEATRLAEEALVGLLREAEEVYGIRTFYWEQTPIRREGPVGIGPTLAHLERVERLRGGKGAEFALCLDVGHAICEDASGEDRDPYVWLERLAPYSPIVHLQQTDGRYDRHWTFTEENNGRGIIEAERVLDALRRSRAKEAFLLLEVGHPFEENDHRVRKEVEASVAYWRDAIRDCERRMEEEERR